MIGEKERLKPETRALLNSGRVAIERCRPTVDGGVHVAKGTVGLPLQIGADIFADGFDLLLAWARHGPPAPVGWDGTPWQAPPGHTGSTPAGTGAVGICGAPPLPAGWTELALDREGGESDRWSGWFTPDALGPWAFDIVALRDQYGTWLHNLRLRADDGQDVAVELEEGAVMADRRSRDPSRAPEECAELVALAAAIRGPGPAAQRIDRAGEPAAVALMRRTEDRSQATVAGPFRLWVDRERAGFSAWYELFPRSEGATPERSGTLAAAALRLPAIAAMGFDIVYLPPIHPIGITARRGKNNSDTPGPHDPGSPWGIGSSAGGHTAVHPDLGTLADFDAFVATARRQGLEVALDYALQCSPDHPWVSEHPEWFKHRPDGTIRYAENPPKRYFDIFPFDFDTPHRAELWAALRDIMRYWVNRGVRAFRVDNPHTKPFAFWEWLITEIHRENPDVLFLAEAFTRDTVRYRLSKVGFTQSYTDFTWRTTKGEISRYLRELSSGELPDWFRPNFWVNTPDILHKTLHLAGPGAFRLRMLLAAITGPSWGMYSGYELGENVPAAEGSEEYLDSEKYEYRPRNWSDPASHAPLATAVNAVRRRHHRAIAQMRTLRLHAVDNDRMLCVSRRTTDRSDVLLMILNLDPDGPQHGTISIDLEDLGLAEDEPYEVQDELSGRRLRWRGGTHTVSLDPANTPAYILHVQH